jgi:hypothetical protein
MPRVLCLGSSNGVVLAAGTTVGRAVILLLQLLHCAGERKSDLSVFRAARVNGGSKANALKVDRCLGPCCVCSSNGVVLAAGTTVGQAVILLLQLLHCAGERKSDLSVFRAARVNGGSKANALKVDRCLGPCCVCSSNGVVLAAGTTVGQAVILLLQLLHCAGAKKFLPFLQ